MNDAPFFVDDISLKNPLFALTIRSPAARGRLRGIECPRMPNAYSLIKAPDIPGKNRLAIPAVPVLAEGAVSYIGEPVALLVGPDEVKLNEYAALCTVQVEEENPFFFRGSLSPESLIAKRDIRLGDTEQSFSGAKTIIGGTYRTGIQDHLYSDPPGAAAVLSREKSSQDKPYDKIVIHTATQWPFHVRNSVAAVLGVPPEIVVVEPSAMGVHLDGKIWYPSLIACHAALGAFILKKPVKLILTREEDFRYSPKRGGTEIQIRTALGDGGQILGTEIQVVSDMGAAGEGIFTDEILDRTCLGALGAYEWDNLTLRGFALGSNIPPAGPFCGFGLSQGFFAVERHISRIADAQRQDPAEWRKNNRSSKNIAFSFGLHHKGHIPLEEIMDTAAAMSDYRRKWASYELLRTCRRGKRGEDREPLRGIGIASAYQGNGFLYTGTNKGAYEVELTLEKNGSLEIKTSMVSSGKEHISLWQGIAAEILAIDAGAVRVAENRTDLVPDSGPDSLSRNITIITKLVERACVAIRGQRFRDPLPITVRRAYHPAKIPNWEGKPFDQNALVHLSWGAAVVEVEIDPVEYTPKIRGAWLGIDGGRILSENRARKSLVFSTIHALGWASREDLAYESGEIPHEYATAYGMLSPEDIPPIHIDFIWNDTVNPKGIGDLPFNCVPAAYVQAVSQAMDYSFEKIPVTGKDVWNVKKTLEEKEQEL
jgi:CO/xanthine dehydrogenase Mo-binding subunit